MTYDPYRIEISTTGEVTRGGKLLGTMAFASLAARMDAAGEHYTEEAGPDYEDDLAKAEDERDSAEHDIRTLRHEIGKAVNSLNKIINGEPVKIAAIRDHLEGLM